MADKNKNEKTNVMRILDKESVPYQVHTYSPDTGIDALSVSNALGQDPQTVFKTLVTQGKSRAYYVFVIPATGSLNLKHAAAACGEKAVEMIQQKASSQYGIYPRRMQPDWHEKALPHVYRRKRTAL